MSKTHLQLTFREIDLVHFGTLRARAIDYASRGRRESARRVGALARELWQKITSKETP